MSSLTDCFHINTLGTMRVTRAFLPFLRRSRGSRLVFVTSIEDRVEPLNQPIYAASKFAIRAFANACRRELRCQGVHVAVVAPAFYATELARKEELMSLLQRNWSDTSAEVRTAYGEDHYKLFVDFTDALYAIIHKDLTGVVDAMADAVVRSCQPKYHRRICNPLEAVALWVADLLPEELMDILSFNPLMIALLRTVGVIRNAFS